MGFGYACDETEELMPLTHVLATKIGHRLTVCRKTGVLPWLLPDGKTQVTVEYTKKGGFLTPNRVHTILISTQHKEEVTNEQIQKDLMKEVIKPVVPAKYLDKKFDFRAGMIGEHLDLKRGVVGGKRGPYLKTAAYGHFGRDDQDVFTWEKVIPLLD